MSARHPSHRPEHEELLALYALEVLEGEDRARLEEHLATGCERCRWELAERRGEVAALAELEDPVAPAPEVRRALLERVERAEAVAAAQPGPTAVDRAFRGGGGTAPAGVEDPSTKPRSGGAGSVSRWLLPIAAVLLLGCLAVLGWSFGQQRGLREQVDQLAADKRELLESLRREESRVLHLQNRLVSLRSALRTAADEPEAVLAGLEPPGGPRGEARGRVYRARGGALLVVDALPPAPSGRTYQLWGIVGGQPVPAGTFDTTEEGGGYLWSDLPGLPAGSSVDVWAITEEPAGGVPQPTGTMVLKS